MLPKIIKMYSIIFLNREVKNEKIGVVRMKKLLIIMMVILGTVVYSRDFEYSEKETRYIEDTGSLEKMGRYALREWFPEEGVDRDLKLGSFHRGSYSR